MTAARDRLVRHLNLGKYGEQLADEILAQHIIELDYDAKREALINLGFEEVPEEEGP